MHIPNTGCIYGIRYLVSSLSTALSSIYTCTLTHRTPHTAPPRFSTAACRGEKKSLSPHVSSTSACAATFASACLAGLSSSLPVCVQRDLERVSLVGLGLERLFAKSRHGNLDIVVCAFGTACLILGHHAVIRRISNAQERAQHAKDNACNDEGKTDGKAAVNVPLVAVGVVVFHLVGPLEV